MFDLSRSFQRRPAISLQPYTPVCCASPHHSLVDRTTSESGAALFAASISLASSIDALAHPCNFHTACIDEKLASWLAASSLSRIDAIGILT